MSSEFSMRISASDYWRMFCHGNLEEQPQRVQAFAQAYADLHEKLGRLLSMAPGPPIPVEPSSNLSEILERARVVGVLDAWARNNPGDSLAPRYLGDDAQPGAEWELFTGKEWERFETPDEARAKAAKAIEAGELR